MKIYTKHGDNGTCGLFSGERVPKCHDRINAFGEIDELNSTLGVLRALLPTDQESLADEIQCIQGDLFHIGAWIATSRNSPAITKLMKISDEQIRFLEDAIDRMEFLLPDISDFVIPGGNKTAAYAYLARAVCRRAERYAVRISTEASLGNPPIQLAGVIRYLNRLSDYLFVLARHLNERCGVADGFWIDRHAYAQA